MANRRPQIDPRATKAAVAALSTVGKFAKKHPRIAFLGVLAFVLFIAFFSSGKPDKVVGFVDSNYLKVSSQSTNNGSFSVYETPLDALHVYREISAASIPDGVSQPSASSYILKYPNTTVSLSELRPEGTKITVDAKIDTETRNSILRALIYVLAEFGDSLGDIDTNDSPYDNKAPPTKEPSWQVDEPSTGGSGSFIERNEDVPSGGSTKSDNTYNIDPRSNEINEPSTTEGTGTFHLR